MAQPTYDEAEDFGSPERVAAAVLLSGQNPDSTEYALPVRAGEPLPITAPEPLPVEPFTYEYKAVQYANVAAYQAGLAVEVAAGWEPHDVTSLLIAAAEQLIVTYKRRT